ncbi:WD repeat-containing protein 46 [Trichinella papuae]|uniref:WD repeat-containing protein 46 n=1 Tax=Trichinella papuae TaxID=268474 RepID=A0A0V1MYK7_9BILA|nr:WD repeat-containing protein 46 [Trichinella papuae]
MSSNVRYFSFSAHQSSSSLTKSSSEKEAGDNEKIKDEKVLKQKKTAKSVRQNNKNKDASSDDKSLKRKNNGFKRKNLRHNHKYTKTAFGKKEDVIERAVPHYSSSVNNVPTLPPYEDTDFKTKFGHIQYASQRDKATFGILQAARSEILLPEEEGFLEADEGEQTYHVTQHDITESVDLASSSKYFELNLPKFGPYRLDFTRNGRNVLLGGQVGHVAAFDWLNKALKFEINVMEAVRDVQWLHNETMLAVAQKRWTYVYDNKGTELHCLKRLSDVMRLEFLPYHYLLVGSSKTSFLHWLDISVGKLVQSTLTRRGPIDVMCQNPSNAIIHCGHGNGTVTLWSPTVKKPLVSMLCYSAPVRSVAVEQTGNFMATVGADRIVKVWDLRNYAELHRLKVPYSTSHMVFSQRGLLACSMGTFIRVYKDICKLSSAEPYMIHNCKEVVTDLRFCPFEDVLGVGHRTGYCNLLIPGSGEANIDAFESNPFQSLQQRREMEVRSLLDKIQPELITLDPQAVTHLDRDYEAEKLQHKVKFLFSKMPKSNQVEKKTAKNKQAIRNQQQREVLRKKRDIRLELQNMGILKQKSKKVPNAS